MTLLFGTLKLLGVAREPRNFTGDTRQCLLGAVHGGLPERRASDELFLSSMTHRKAGGEVDGQRLRLRDIPRYTNTATRSLSLGLAFTHRSMPQKSQPYC